MQELTSVMGCVSDQVVMWYYFAFSGTTVLTFILFIFNHRFQNLMLSTLMLALFFPQVAGIHFHILIMFVGNSITQWKVFNYLATAYVTVFLWRRANARNVRLYYHRIGSTPTFQHFPLYYSAYHFAGYGVTAKPWDIKNPPTKKEAFDFPGPGVE